MGSDQDKARNIERRQRLAQALRSNLRRRKDQAHSRAKDAEPLPGEAPENEAGDKSGA